MRDSDKRAVQEMARIMCKPPSLFAIDTAEDILNCCYLAVRFAERLYFAGYRKQIEGEWLVKWRSTFPQYEPSEYECSICGYKRTVLHNYCPNCGAKMKGV